MRFSRRYEFFWFPTHSVFFRSLLVPFQMHQIQMVTPSPSCSTIFLLLFKGQLFVYFFFVFYSIRRCLRTPKSTWLSFSSFESFFTPALADCFPLESEWKQVSLSPLYSGWSQQRCRLDGFHSSSYFQTLRSLYQFFGDCTDHTLLQLVLLLLSCSIVVVFFSSVLLQELGTYLSFAFLKFLPCVQPECQNPLFDKFSIIIIIIIIINIIIIIYSFRFFHWSLRDSMCPQVSRTRLRSLAVLSNAVIWIVSTRPPTSKSSRPFNIPLAIVPKALITIATIVTFMFHSFFNSQARSRYLYIFSHSFRLLSLQLFTWSHTTMCKQISMVWFGFVTNQPF